MRVLIIAAVFACAAAAPSGLLAAPYVAGGVVAPLAPALPTISSGDIEGATLEAHAYAADNARAALDATRGVHDQAAELQGRALNAAEENGWKAVDAVKTVEAQLDGAAAGTAPVLAKSLVGAPALVAAPVAYSSAPAYAASVVAAPTYAAGALVAGSESVSTQSLTQTHPAPAHAYLAPAVSQVAYAAAPFYRSGLLAQAW